MGPWSFSRLSAFRQCPRQFYELKIERNFQETVHPTTAGGSRGHKALELRVRDGEPLPSEFSYLESFAQKIIAMPGQMSCELELACTEDLTPVAFNSPEAWARGIIDLFKFKDTEAVALDYKFGKVKPSDQLKQNALLIFANFPTVRTVKTKFLWLAHRETTDGEYHREDASALWQDFKPIVEQLKQAHEGGIWTERPSGLCKAHCPVTTCQYHGIGNKRRY